MPPLNFPAAAVHAGTAWTIVRKREELPIGSYVHVFYKVIMSELFLSRHHHPRPASSGLNPSKDSRTPKNDTIARMA